MSVKVIFDVDVAMDRVAAIVRPLPKAAMFELAKEGFNTPFEQAVACIISVRTLEEVTLHGSIAAVLDLSGAGHVRATRSHGASVRVASGSCAVGISAVLGETPVGRQPRVRRAGRLGLSRSGFTPPAPDRLHHPKVRRSSGRGTCPIVVLGLGLDPAHRPGGEMLACPQCGVSNDEAARFCSSCGRPLAGQGPSVSAGATGGADASGEDVTPRIRTRIPGFVKNTLSPSERVLAAYRASLFDHHKQGTSFAHDKFVLTPQRIIYYHTGIFRRGMGEMPYRMITGVNYEQGFLHGKVIVEAANAGLTLDGIGNADAAFAEKIIAGGMSGKTFRATGPSTEPPLIGPLAIIGVILIVVLIAFALVAGPTLPLPHLP